MGKQSSDIGQNLARAARLARTDPARAILIHYEVLSRFPNNRRSLAALSEMVREQLPGILSVTDRLAASGGVAEALVLVETLGRAAPHAPPLVTATCRYLIHQGRHEAAERRVDAALAVHPEAFDLLRVKAVAQVWQGKSTEAAARLRSLAAKRPDLAELHNMLGVALRSLGDTAGARAAFLRAIDSPSGQVEAWSNLAGMVDFARDRDLFEKLHRYLARPDRDARTNDHLDFTFAKAAEDLGDIDAAFAAFARGNAARKTMPGRSGADVLARDAALLKGIEDNFDAIDHGSVRWNGPRPVFVLGMPRSGTTLVERIIGAHPDAIGAGELRALQAAVETQLNQGRAACGAEISARYLREIARLDGNGAVLVDKMPMNFRYVGFVLAAYPHANVIHTRRDPIATCFSNFRQRFSSNGMAFADDLTWLVRYHTQYQAYMRFWRARFGERILDLDYEALTEDQESETRRILDFIGLDWDPSCLSFHTSAGAVQTASVMQVRRGMYRGSSEVWRRYAAHLDVLTDGLAEAAQAHAQRRDDRSNRAAALGARAEPMPVAWVGAD